MRVKENKMTPQDLMGKYEKALESQKWQKVEPLMDNDICVTFSTGTFKGKQEVKQVFEKNFSLIKEEKYSISNLYWDFIGVRDFNNPPDRSLITAMSCIDVHGFFHIFHRKKAIFYR